MRVINRKQLKWQHRRPPEEKKPLDSIKKYITTRKAALIGCLFLCVCLPVYAQEWSFDSTSQEAYEHVLRLELQEVHTLIPQPESAQEHYVTALAEAVELLLTEDGEKYTDYEERFEQRLDRKTRLNTPDDIFLQAEIRIQWAFVYFKFGHEFDAALNLRQAYLTTEEINRRFPEFQAIKKTSALLDVILGSVPEKYSWVLSLLGIEGDIGNGLAALDTLRTSQHPIHREADMLYALIQGFILQKPEEGIEVLSKSMTVYPNNKLILYLASALAIKNAESKRALEWLQTIDRIETGLPIFYCQYLKGEVYLHKGEYLNSISSYRWFLNHYEGQNHIKDANYKIGLCYYLNGNANDAVVAFQLARNVGKETTEADKYAARSLAEKELPHTELTKARYLTDGGYYSEARVILESLTPDDLPTTRDQVEFYYRRARLEHNVGNMESARLLYDKTITENGLETWYFAPNACLQMGYIYLAERKHALAEEYFQRALSYNKHEYKNSIDTKAKSALAQLRRK
jgi:hypothetical protein